MPSPDRAPRRLAVALHDVEPATFERCALIRDWLADLGVGRATLLVVPASDLHPLQDRSPALSAWIAQRRAAGDAVAQQGLEHRPGEFSGLGADETRRRVLAGRRVLKLAGLDVRGFVAPAYAYTPALRATCAERFDWWASAHGLHGRFERTAQPGDHTRALKVGCLLALPRARMTHAPLLRLDIHPHDLDRPRRVLALERVVRAAARRDAVTYDELSATA